MEPHQPTTLQTDAADFVTVVSVGTESSPIAENNNNSSFVTVLKIGEGCGKAPLEVIEEVLVYRLPGERLGFGLKFEGGTKTAEFVKRLFIQSCAPDSPASRVRSSWGKLVEGDEILEIDSLPVKSMTRIDCVRCLKDSNVVIKLKVKHTTDADAESAEDLPQIISAEKKRVPPPPPPVPPRKIPRKLFKNNTNNTTASVPAKVPTENGVENLPPVSASRNGVNDTVPNGNQVNRFQSPRNSGRFNQRNGHEPAARDRRVSDGSIGPPDPEVYTDLFSQESTCSLSESDDTGSSISTIVDRLGSCPTTTTSSLADSLPSTPTSIQRHLDLNHLNPYDNDEIDFDSNDNNYLFANLTQAEELPVDEKLHSEGNSLQPPTCFQDAPLSYGNENVRTTEYNSNVNNGLHNNALHENGANKDVEMPQQPPPPPPRTKNLSLMSAEKNKNDSSGKVDDRSNTPDLPRLVDFVPKSSKSDGVSEQIEVMKLFLENEKRASNGGVKDVQDGEEDNSDEEIWQEDADYYGFNWSNCTQLATIGEDEEEANHDTNSQRPQNPIVIVESADGEKKETAVKDTDDVHMETEDGPAQREARVTEEEKPRSSDTDGSMEAPPTCSRQPPDGHEFPDYQEAAITTTPIKMEESKTRKYWDPSSSYLHKDHQSSHSVRDKIAIFSQTASSPVTPQIKSYKSTEDVFNNVNSENFDKTKSLSRSVMSLDKTSFGTIGASTKQTPEPVEATLLHKRSQSLVDMTSILEQRSADRWSLLVEQRRRGLSKLKGLVIPEPVAEDDGVKRPVIDIPEIKNSSTINVAPIVSREPAPPNKQTPITPPLSTPQWTPPSANNIPKYSPAFKRKGLQIYSAASITRNNSVNTDKKKQDPNGASEKTFLVKTAKLPSDEEEYRYPTSLSLSDAPKSLESITSPTRSDCSFEYLSSSPELKLNQQVRSRGLNNKDDVGRSEDESDNDSAVSSSQSSYISRSSPPASPNHLHFSIRTPCNMLEADSNDRQRRTGSQQELQAAGKYDSLNRRLLKPQSVEAINRKNILASAKCRSGRDLKGGSPLIQRKFDEEENRKTTKPLNDLPALASPPDIIKTDVIPEKPPVNNTQPAKSIDANKTELPALPARPSLLNKRTDDPLPLPKILSRNVRTTSVTDLRKSFEQMGPVPAKISREPARPTTINNNTSIKPSGNAFTEIKRNRDIKAEQKLDVTKVPAHPIPKKSDDQVGPPGLMKTVVLKAEFPGGSVGITLAGGTDYETKEITVHKVRSGSVACKDGRLQKGDRVISINGKTMTGLTHAESVAILKEKVPEVTIEACTADPVKDQEPPSSRRSSSASLVKEAPAVAVPAKLGQAQVVTVMKDIAGLGFSVEGGKDSPIGDVPLRIKKIFAGGAAEKCGLLSNGDELLAINDADVSCMSKMDAWNLMRRLPEGAVTLTVRR